MSTIWTFDNIEYKHSIYYGEELKFNVLKEIGSNCDYQFIIKELANDFKGQFECLWENTKKYQTFFIPIEKETIKVDKTGNKLVIILVTNFYKIHFLDNARFMARSLSNIVDNLAEEIHKIKCRDSNYCLVKHHVLLNNC